VSALVHFDEKLFVLLNQRWTSPVLDRVMPFITDFDHWRIPVIAIVFLVLLRSRRETRIAILFAILAVVAADQISSSLVKPLFDRPRPEHTMPGARVLVDAHDSSFPSSHAANTFAAGTFLAARFPRLRAILIVPAIVSYSRVYVGVHYPWDVVAGGALGAGVGAAFLALERVLRGRWLPRSKKVKP
jgi:undecaprenyl-diphosphatase